MKTTRHEEQEVTPNPPQAVQLGAGESLLFWTKAGISLLSNSGSLVVTGTPLWLGEQVFRARTPLEPGQVHLIEQDGWITLTAGPQGEAVCLVIPKSRPSLMRALGKVGKVGKVGKQFLRRLPGIAKVAGT